MLHPAVAQLTLSQHGNVPGLAKGASLPVLTSAKGPHMIHAFPSHTIYERRNLTTCVRELYGELHMIQAPCRVLWKEPGGGYTNESACRNITTEVEN